MILSSHGFIASQITQFVGLLDVYSGAAAAYSLRRLSGTYSGKAIRVRRTDLEELDIGFTDFGELDTTALLAFTGTGALDNGFVKTWYDQSGNGYNAIQTTAANQPQIVSGGSVILENGKPAVQFDGSDDRIGIYSGMPTTIFDSGEFTAFTVGLANDNNTEQRLFALSTDTTYFFLQRMLTNTDIIASYTNLGGVQNSILYTNWGSSVLFYNKVVENGTSDAAINGNSIVSSAFTTFGGVASPGWSLGSARSGLTNYLNGKIQEAIFYNLDQSSNRTGIETNINDFYSIY